MIKIQNVLLLFLFVMLVGNSYAQNIPEKANTIIVTVDGDAADKVNKVLTKQGFTVKQDKKNPSLYNTDPKTIKNNTRVALSAEVNGNEVVIKGRITATGQSSLPIEYKGAKGTAAMNAWEEMEKAAKALGTNVKYEVR